MNNLDQTTEIINFYLLAITAGFFTILLVSLIGSKNQKVEQPKNSNNIEESIRNGRESIEELVRKKGEANQEASRTQIEYQQVILSQLGQINVDMKELQERFGGELDQLRDKNKILEMRNMNCFLKNKSLFTENEMLSQELKKFQEKEENNQAPF